MQCDEETNTPTARDRYEIICRVIVKPTKTAEFIYYARVTKATARIVKDYKFYLEDSNEAIVTGMLEHRREENLRCPVLFLI